MEADCFEIFETGRTLLATLGYPIFDPVATPVTSAKAEEILYCKPAGSDGRGLYTPEGFVVLKGSIGRKDHVPTFSASNKRFRKRLFDAGVIREDGETVVFDKDHLFGSPSMAAIALLGRTANGWKEWRNAEGVTLDKLKRAAPEAES